MKLWTARNKDGSLWLHKDKPSLSMSGKVFTSGIFGGFFNIDDKLFPEVTFDNSPREVELNLI